MVSKLVFKGDKPTKKRKSKNGVTKSTPSRTAPSLNRSSKGPTVDTATDETEDVWTSALSLKDLVGPIVLAISGDDETPVCIAADAEGKVYTSTNLNLPSSDRSKAVAHICEPVNVQQVFVVTPASFDENSEVESSSKKIALKTSSGCYLSADKLGIMTAKATAIGPQQTFTLTPLENGVWSIQTVWEKFVAIEKDDSSLSGYTARADADAIGFCETFSVRMQSKYQRKIKSTNRVSDRYISSEELESRAGIPLSRDQIKILKRAYKDGRLNEALLDIRQKSKTDTRCY